MSAQNDNVLERYINRLSMEEQMDEGNLEEFVEQLTYLSQHPKNINEATREDFEQLPFLTDIQVEKLCEYLYRYSPMRSIGELAMIPVIDNETRELLKCFFYIGDEVKKGWGNLSDALRFGHHELVVTGKIPFYKREGYINGNYLGSQYQHSFRYTFNYSDKLSAGLVGAQDAGEPFFKHGNNFGYDHYAFFVQLKHLGIVKQAVAGHYRVRFGQGLVINTNLSFGKIAQQQLTTRNTVAITPHMSKMQSNYLQGIAATLTLSKKIELTLFGSHRGIDATLSKDKKTITTILTSNYHRTVVEMEKKNDAKETMIGGHVTYDTKRGFVFGASALWDNFNKSIEPGNQRYRQYYPKGDHFTNYSVDYGYRSHRFSVSGETALCNGGALATVNQLSWRPTNDVQLMAIHRFYSYKYTALHAEAFNNGGRVQNESGIYLGIDWRPSAACNITAYTDYAYYPWDKYLAKGASKSWDNLIQATYVIGKTSLFARYRYKTQQRNATGKEGLWWQQEHRMRLNVIYLLWKLKLKTQADYTIYQLVNRTTGWVLSQQAECDVLKRITLVSSFAYFHTQDYNSRVYLYERQPLYSISFPYYYGKGIRCSLFSQTTITNNLFLALRVGFTKYFDRNTIGSDRQRIDGSSMTDLDVQIRWKF